MSMFVNLRSRLAGVALAAAAAAAGGCADTGRAADGDASGDSVSPDSMGAVPVETRTVALRLARKVRESSALAMSTTQPGVLFTINDSGNEAVLFAFDTTGADRGSWRVRNADNVDWEALAFGPCSGTSSARCVYIGDIGDNDMKHSTGTIYRVTEPDAKDSAYRGAVRAERVRFRYSDRRHDVEAMYVASNGDAFLVTKRPQRTVLGRLRPALVFRVPSAAWSRNGTAVAELIDSLTLVPGSAPLRTITDASLSADGRLVAVRTNSQLFVYAADTATGRVNGAVPAAICNLIPLGEEQGEGVTWVASSGRFAFSSEGRVARLQLASCPVPH
jgi:hypothetical protein